MSRIDGTPRSASSIVGSVVTRSSSMILGFVSRNNDRPINRTGRRPGTFATDAVAASAVSASAVPASAVPGSAGSCVPGPDAPVTCVTTLPPPLSNPRRRHPGNPPNPLRTAQAPRKPTEPAAHRSMTGPAPQTRYPVTRRPPQPPAISVLSRSQTHGDTICGQSHRLYSRRRISSYRHALLSLTVTGMAAELANGNWRKIVGTGVFTRKTALRAAVTASAVLAVARCTKSLEPEMLGLPDVVGPGGVCVDVGSAAGLYTVPLSRLVGPSGVVHSVEPLPFAWPVWNRVLGAREKAHVQPHSLAPGAEPARATLSGPTGR